jgi:hypothetical protein
MHRIVNATNANLISNFYMDEQNTYEGHARNLFARYKQLHPDNRLGSLTYGNRTQFPALQVADLLAYLWNAQLNREPSPFEIQVMWMLLNERHESIDVWRKDTFAEFRAGVIERKSLKGDWSEEDFKRAQRYLESLENNENQN